MPFAVVGAAAGIYTAYEGAKSASSTQKAANTASGQSTALFGEQQGYEKMLQDYFNNPSSVTSLPGYNFQEQQGEQAVTRQMSAGGYLGSGNLGIALQQYGQNFAMNYGQTYEQQLAALSGLSQNASAPLQTAVQGSNAAFGQYGQLGGAGGSMFQAGGGMSTISNFFQGGGGGGMGGAGGATSASPWLT
jgi:hypothetical protein